MRAFGPFLVLLLSAFTETQAGTTATTTVLPAQAAPAYVVLTSGTCASPLTQTECQAIAAQIKAPGLTSNPTICTSGTCAPVGCYQYFSTGSSLDQKVFYNSDKSGTCSTKRKCFCKATCSQPTTVGYDFSSVTGSTFLTGFGVSGVTCATGYTGKVTITPCTSAGGDWAVSGCQATCTQPTTAGYDFSKAIAVTSSALSGFRVAGVVCATGYAGSVTVTPCTSAGKAYTVSGCQAACTQPTTAGYDFSSVTGSAAPTGFTLTGVVCATGYAGSVTVTPCTSAGSAYTVSGCQATCMQPTTAGYDFSKITAVTSSTVSGFRVAGVVCATGYAGTVTVTPCTSAGSAYTVSGCQAACTTPATAGYDYAKAAGSTTISTFAVTGVVCATGYAGSVTVNPCTSAGGAYTVSGCQGTCTQPSTTGYDFHRASGSANMNGFKVTDVFCAVGYMGVVTALPCTAAGGPYTVSGCQAACAAPKTTVGYDFTGATGFVSIANFQVSGVVCASGYTGAVISTKCSSPGTAYTVSGCQAACTAPSTVGYVFTGATGPMTIANFLVTGVVCASKYTGTVKITKCSSPGAVYSVSGCQATCTQPSTVGYNFAAATGSTTQSGLAVVGVVCASGYTGTVTYTPCTLAGDTYTVSGCKAMTCPLNSAGTNVVSGCSCTAGYTGTITASSTAPYYSGLCSAVACPANAAGTGVPSGCSCNAGYTGTISAISASPSYNGSCSIVACPVDSTGTNVPGGCTCNTGHKGIITASTAFPYYTGSCQAQCTVPSTVGYSFAAATGSLAMKSFSISGVVCAPGFTGTVKYTPCTVSGGSYTVSGCQTTSYVAIDPSTGVCPAGRQVTESECSTLNGISISGKMATFTSAVTRPSPETCGCYFDDKDGKVYYNRRGTTCGTADPGEVLICKAICTTPSTISYNFKSAAGTFTILGFAPSGVVCKSGYVGTVTYKPCTKSLTPYVVSGCEATCTAPTKVGYNFSGATGPLDISNFAVVGVVCASGYKGTVKVSKCTGPGTPYFVSGCQAFCRVPFQTPGYNFSGAAAGATQKMFFNPTGIVCASGYVGTVQTTACSSAGSTYSVSGCQADCTVPSTLANPNYNFAAAAGATTKASFNPSGVACAKGYAGTVKYAACTTAGGPYSVSGCKATCTHPTASVGYDFALAKGVLTVPGFAVTGIVCAKGYVGSVISTECTAPGTPYVVTGCEEICTVPSKPGYNFAGAGGVLKKTGFKPTGVICANKYVGAVTYTECPYAGAPYGVGGCEATVMVDPSTGTCALGQQLTETECASLNGASFRGNGVVYVRAGSYANPETCGCYFDQNGKVYFNRRTTMCNMTDPGEKSICKAAPNHLRQTSGKCAVPLTEVECKKVSSHINAPGYSLNPNICTTPDCQPNGCYQYITTGLSNQNVYYNTANTGSCSQSMQCLCKATAYAIDPSPGVCPAGLAFDENECASLNGTIIAGRPISFQNGGLFQAPSTCGCYFDQSGLVYYNRRTTTCNMPHVGEMAICKVPGTGPTTTTTATGANGAVNPKAAQACRAALGVCDSTFNSNAAVVAFNTPPTNGTVTPAYCTAVNIRVTCDTAALVNCSAAQGASYQTGIATYQTWYQTNCVSTTVAPVVTLVPFINATTSTTMALLMSSGGAGSSGSLMSSLASFNEGSSVSAGSAGSSSGSTASGSSGSYLQIWQWFLLLALLSICIGGIIAALTCLGSSSKRSSRGMTEVDEDSDYGSEMAQSRPLVHGAAYTPRHGYIV